MIFMSDPQTNFITWQLLALGALSLLQIVVLGISSWVLMNILKFRAKHGKLSGRVSHIEGHLEMADHGSIPFKRLEVES